MKRFATGVLIVAMLAVVGLALDRADVVRAERRLSEAVARCGGRIGSIPFWPFGAEYGITLNRVPDDDELRELAIAERMRGAVGIAFEDCDVSDADRMRLLAALPRCRLFVVRDGSTASLDRNER